jgi:hypothetical protein
MEYYAAIKHMLFVGKWMEIIMLNKISQTEKDKHCMFLSYAESIFF